VHVTPEFTRRFAADLVRSDLLLVRLRPGVDPAAFLDAVAAVSPGTTVSVLSAGADHARTVQRSIHLQAVGLAILAALVGLSAAFALGQAFARQAFVGIADDLTALRTLGMTRGQFVAVAMARAAVTASAGAISAVAVAVAVSPLWPVGLAREAEPDPGFAVDAVVLGVGALVILTLALVVSAVATIRQVKRSAIRSPATSRSVASRLAGRIGLPMPATVGVRHALEPGRGRTAVPVRSAMLATALAVTVLVAAMTIGASTQHLLDTRALYGWSRDAQIGSDGTPPLASAVVAGLEQSSSAAAFAAGTVTDLEINGARVSAFALDDLRGEVAVDLLSGRRPRATDEIVLGIKTVRDVDAEVGDRVPVRVGRRRTPMTVVGSAVFSRIGSNGQLGRGAQITFRALQRALPDAPKNVVHIDFDPAADEDAVRAQLQDAVSALPVIAPAPPAELTSFGRVDNLPTVLATIMIAVAAAILAHTMITSVQRRRRDFAVLQSLGFVRRQVSVAVTMQATTFAVVSALIGIPLGFVIGRWVWAAIADELEVPSEPTTRALVVLLIVPGVILLANLVAALPAWLARGTQPAAELRAE
jgi:ABC-type lipoprotein release transport system permease subunit